MALVLKPPICSAFAPVRPKIVLISKNFRILSSNSNSVPGYQKNLPELRARKDEEDAVQLAFAKAKAYKKSVNPKPQVDQNPLPEVSREIFCSNSDEVKHDSENEEVPLAVKLALEKAKEYKKNKDAGRNQVTTSLPTQISDSESGGVEEKSNFLKSEELPKDEDKDVPLDAKLAMAKAKEFKKNIGVIDGGDGSETSDQVKGETLQNPSVKRNAGKEELSVSSIDFIGLSFSDKKSGRGLPAGLVPISDPFSEGDLPEVEIIVGDMSNFDTAIIESKPMQNLEDDAEVYKPKVSTWGVFPRPSNISKTYGGGRVIRPGETLESKENRADKEARTKQLLAAYKAKTGRYIDPKLKAVCEKALDDGDSLMASGKLKEAIPFYEQVLEKLPFQSELHGLAALQWSICQDSLSMPDEARMMYEKLQSHPSPPVSKKARQLVFGFQAMEMMKVSSSNVAPLSTGYRDYFEAFLEDKVKYQSFEAEVDEGSLGAQALPYIFLLLSPILIISLIAALKSP